MPIFKYKLREINLIHSPFLIFLILLMIIFLSEASIMWLLQFLDLPEGKIEDLTDASLLTLLIVPFVWFLIFRPLRNMALDQKLQAEQIIVNANDGIITIILFLSLTKVIRLKFLRN